MIYPILTKNHQIVTKTLEGNFVLLKWDGKTLKVRMKRSKITRIKQQQSKGKHHNKPRVCP